MIEQSILAMTDAQAGGLGFLIGFLLVCGFLLWAFRRKTGKTIGGPWLLLVILAVIVAVVFIVASTF